MAEIAADCDMSVGNLYRFYRNKEEIAVSGARCCMSEKAQVAEQAAEQVDGGMEKVRHYCLARLAYLHRFVSETPHMYELVQLISGKHRDVLQHFEERASDSIRQMLASGVEQGEFRRCDCQSLAADIYNATNKYNMPLCMDAPLPVLEAELNSLIDLLFEGLKAS